MKKLLTFCNFCRIISNFSTAEKPNIRQLNNLESNPIRITNPNPMKKILTILTFAAFASLSAHAQIINVEFASYVNGGPYAGTGADPLDTGTVWNQFTNGGSGVITGSNLKDSNGAPTTFSVSTAADGGSTVGNTTNLFNGYLYTVHTSLTSPSTVTINTGLFSQAFTIYLYDQSGSNTTGRPTAFALDASNGGAAASTLNTVASNSFVLGQNYVVLTGVTSATGAVTVDFASITQAGNGNHVEGDLNGLQLDFTATTAPEPSTYALMAASLGALVFFVRRRLTA